MNHYAPHIEAIARRLSVNPLLIEAVGEVESRWGTANHYSPVGPTGVGDYKPRYRKVKPSTGIAEFYNAVDRMLFPPVWDNGAMGFGLGLMQIDAEYHWAWATKELSGAPQWMDAFRNIEYGATLLKGLLDTFKGNPRAAVSAYNAGARNVLEAIRQGKDPDSRTTGGDYASRVLTEFTRRGGSHLV